MNITQEREMLALVAKAIGGELSLGNTKRRTGHTWDEWEWAGPIGITAPADWHPYGGITLYPLQYNGDALQIATRLRIKVWFEDNAPPELKLPRQCAIALHGERYTAVPPVKGDEDGAIRLAVARAAAEVGRAMS